MKPRVKIASAVAVLALAGGVGVGVAVADPTAPPAPTPSATPSGSTKPDPNKDAKQRRGLMARALHGEVTLAGRHHEVVVFQRGTVTEVDATKITVESADGFKTTYVVNAETRLRKDKQDIEIGQIKVSDNVRVVATKDGSPLTAKVVRYRR